MIFFGIHIHCSFQMKRFIFSSHYVFNGRFVLFSTFDVTCTLPLSDRLANGERSLMENILFRKYSKRLIEWTDNTQFGNLKFTL